MAAALKSAKEISLLQQKDRINEFYDFKAKIYTKNDCPNSGGYLRSNLKIISKATRKEIDPKLGLMWIRFFKGR